MSYEQDAIDADAALAEAGQQITVTHYAPTRNATTGVVTKGTATRVGTCAAVEVPVTASLMGTFSVTLSPGTLVGKTVRALKVSALLGFQPALNDSITLADGTIWPVIGCTPINPAGVPIIYTVGIAK